MIRDLYVYTCLEDYCGARFESYGPVAVCPECGSPEIEVEQSYLDLSYDYSGR